MIFRLPGRLAPVEEGEQAAAANFLAGDLSEKGAAAALAD